MPRANNDRRSSGHARSGLRRDASGENGSGPRFWALTLLVAMGLLVVLFIAAIAGGYLP